MIIDVHTHLNNYDETQVVKTTEGCKNLHVVAGISFNNYRERDLREIADFLKDRRVVGLKLYPGYEPFYPYDKRCQVIYDLAMEFSERPGRRGQKHEQARERRETDEPLAGRPVKEWLSAHGWSEAELQTRPKGDAGKAELARLLPRQMPVSRQWIADRLHIGSASYVSNLVKKKS